MKTTGLVTASLCLLLVACSDDSSTPQVDGKVQKDTGADAGVQPDLTDDMAPDPDTHLTDGAPPPKDTKAPQKGLESGKWFLLMNVTKPVNYQIQVWVDMIVDNKTQKATGLFVDADRTAAHNGAKCNPKCGFLAPACRTRGVAKPTCVSLDHKAASAMEFADWIAVPKQPAGYTFLVKTPVKGSAEPYSLNTLPFNFSAQSGLITVKVEGGKLVMTIKTDPKTKRQTISGTFSAKKVSLGIIPGVGQGTVTGVRLANSEWPAGAPKNTNPPGKVTWP